MNEVKMDDAALELPSAPPLAEARFRPIAAPWHTAIIVLIVPLWAYRGALHAQQLRAIQHQHQISLYAKSVLLELLLLALTLLGVWLHRSPFSAVLGKSWESVAQFFRDVGVALAFWIVSVLVLAIARATVLSHLSTAPDVKFMLPHGSRETIAWLFVALAAGICEEAVFRGYLQRQFLAWTQNAPVAIVLSAVLFGAMHAYQGIQGALMIGLLGAMLGILAHWRGTVRTGMIAHSWQDAVAGLLAGALNH
jgi:uncharacterized protein